MITSKSNQQVKDLIQLQKKARVRKKRGLFVIEGVRMFSETPPDLITCIYVSESFLADHANRSLVSEYMAAGPAGHEGNGSIPVEVLSDTVFAHVSDTRSPQGILAVVRMPDTDPAGMFAENGPWLVLERIQDPGNLGTIFRTAEGAGVAGIVMDEETADVYAPKVIRSTMGSVYRVPFLITGDLSGTLFQMRMDGIHIYAAHLSGSIPYDEADYTGRCAFLIGNEGRGLSEEAALSADTAIRIPMEGSLESLNAAVAAAVLMYEAARQKKRSI